MGLPGMVGVMTILVVGATPAAADFGAAPAVSSTAPLNTPVALEGAGNGCNRLPLNRYLSQDAPDLKPVFCEMLTFAPQNLTSGEAFYDEIRPGSYTSEEAPSPDAMTLPSLWWSRDSLPRRFGSYRLVDSWAAYEIRASATRVVDVYINPQIWRILQYAERYGALNHLAIEALNYQYQVRLFTSNFQDPRLIGLYVCDFAADAGQSFSAGSFDPMQTECAAVVDAENLATLQATLLNADNPSQASTAPVGMAETLSPPAAPGE